jgi:hypothetical protein
LPCLQKGKVPDALGKVRWEGRVDFLFLRWGSFTRSEATAIVKLLGGRLKVDGPKLLGHEIQRLIAQVPRIRISKKN